MGLLLPLSRLGVAFRRIRAARRPCGILPDGLSRPPGAAVWFNVLRTSCRWRGLGGEAVLWCFEED
jgi:hypothetical protein